MTNPIAAKLTEAPQQNFPEYLEGDSIKWNFTKFLVDREDNVVPLSPLPPQTWQGKLKSCCNLEADDP